MTRMLKGAQVEGLISPVMSLKEDIDSAPERTG